MKKHIIRDKDRDILLFIDENDWGHIIGINYCLDINSEITPELLKADISLSNWVIGRLPVRTFFTEQKWLIEKMIESVYDYANHYFDPACCAGFTTEYSIQITDI